jgi:hypothetical protein
MPFDLFGIEIDPLGFLLVNWWILLIIPVLLVFGISFGWKKLTSLYQMQGKPLRPLGVILKEVKSLMYKEDIYCVITKNGENIPALLWFTWSFFWKWLTAHTFVLIGLSFFLHPTITFWAWILTVVFWLYGVGHLRKIFAYRFAVLDKMFNVAMSEMRYDGGANSKIYIYQYIIVSAWKDVYYPQETQVMYSTNKFRANEIGKQVSFQSAFDSAVTDKHSWSYEWDTANNRVICTPTPFLPNSISYPFPDRHLWNEFPLGKTFGDEEAIWDVSNFPHMLVAGTTGSGKSVTQRTILLHTMQSPDWRVLLIDPKQVELSQYGGHPNVLKIATEIDESYALIQQLEQEMMNRYVRMKEAGVNHFRSLPNVPPAILLMVDEVFALLELIAGASKTDPVIKEQNEMKAGMTLMVGKIARLGRAAGVHMVLATQRPDAKVLPGEVKANLDARIAQGRMDKTPSLMTLDSLAATKLPPIKGRAVFRQGDAMIEFQAYFLSPENLPEFLELSAMIVRGEGDFLFEEEEPQEQAAVQTQKKEKKERKKSSAKKLNMNSFGLGDMFSNWLEKKRAQMEENEARAGRTVVKEEKPKRRVGVLASEPEIEETEENKYVPAALREDFTIDEVASGVDVQGGFEDTSFINVVTPSQKKNEETLFVPEAEKAESFDFGYEEEDWEDETDDYKENEPETNPSDSSVDIDYFDEIEFSVDEDDDFSFEKEEFELRASESPTTSVTQVASEEEEFSEEYQEEVEEADYESEEYPIEEVALTVEDVLRLAAERGVPIPASELLAALRAEAARQTKPAVTPAAPKMEAKPKQENQRTVPEYRPIKPSVRKPLEVITQPPTTRIPTPPKATKETVEALSQVDFGEHLLEPHEKEGENLPPWMQGEIPEENLVGFKPPVFPDKNNPEITRKPEDFLRPVAEEKKEGPKRPKLF